jgi:hypothetical protein
MRIFRIVVLSIFMLAPVLSLAFDRGYQIPGRTQGQSTFLTGGNDYPFVNLLKTGSSWFYVGSPTSHPPPSELDSNGWPTSPIHSGGDSFLFTGPSQMQYPGHYVAKWSGTKKINVFENIGGGIPTVVSCKNGDGSNGTSSGGCLATDGRYEISIAGETTTNNVTWEIQIITTDGAANTNLAFFNINDESYYGWCAIGSDCPNGFSGDQFGKLYKSRIKAGNFAVWRGLDWTNANFANCSSWADRKLLTYAFYGGSEMRAAIYAGSPSYALNGSSNDYAATFGSGAPVDRQKVIVLFNNTATNGTATFNLNSTGSVNIADINGNSAPMPFSTTWPTSGSYGTLVYEADLNVWMLYGGSIADFYHGLDCGAPPEVLVQLCAELGMNPWFPEYLLSADPIQDFPIQLATYIKNNYPKMIPRFEIYNEPWNGLTPGAPYGDLKANKFWGTSFDHLDWDCKIGSLLGQAISGVYGGNSSRYKVVIGVQTSTTPSASNNVLNCPQFVAQAAPPQTGYVKSAAYNWVTGIAVATYWPLVTVGHTYVGLAYQYSVSPAETLLEQIIQTAPDPGPPYGTIIAGWVSWEAGIKSGLQVDGYEGGYNQTLFTSDITQAFTSATNANPAVLTATQNGCSPGMTVGITGASGGTWSTINGNTYTVSANTTNTCTINLDSTGLGALASATLTYTGSKTYFNALIPSLFTTNIVGTYTKSIYENVVAAGMEFPAQYDFSSAGQGGAIFSVWYPSIYGATNSASDPGTPAWGSIVSYNHSTN